MSKFAFVLHGEEPGADTHLVSRQGRLYGYTMGILNARMESHLSTCIYARVLQRCGDANPLLIYACMERRCLFAVMRHSSQRYLCIS